jgi:hypothetical protein
MSAIKNIINRIIIYLAILMLISSVASGQQDPDILQTVLDSAGYTRTDLGYHPKGYWNRYPLDTPHRLASFDDLFAEPLKLYDYAKTMANSVELYLDPTYVDSLSVSLFRLTYTIGVDRKLGGFRNYSAHLKTVTDTAQPIEKALENLFELRMSNSPGSNNEVTGAIPLLGTEISAAIKKIPSDIQRILADAILNLSDIIHWRNLAFRRCNYETMQQAFEIRDLALTQSSGDVYYPELDDLAENIDYSSLHYAALKAVMLTEQTADSLIVYDDFPVGLLVEMETPFGNIILIGRNYFEDADVEELNCTDCMLVIDFGNKGRFTGSCGATSTPANPVSIFIDLGGSDVYTCNTDGQSLGAGILGVGVLYDYSGDDQYLSKDFAQGCGMFGAGMMFDREGDDNYVAELSGQGCGYFGIGLCLDASGNDKYYIHCDGQGFGGVGGGVGVLADFDGNDFYKAEPSPEIFDRSDYHSKHKINANFAQGAAAGRRGDITDGHSWAGGLGAIIDISGDDHYLSGNWSLGASYWFSTGIAYDGNGNDIYESCYFTQGSGAHFCNSILIDEGGNDRHELYETAGAGLGFGYDFVNALLVNIGGDDSYRAKMISIGLAQIRSNAFLFDIGGNDIYRLGEGTAGLGEATYRKEYAVPFRLAPYRFYSKSIGCFIDIGGNDRYLSFNDTEDNKHPAASDNKFWFAPDKNDSTFGADNYGIGLDTESGIIPEINKWQE